MNSINFIDSYLTRITIFRMVLYYLICLVAAAIGFSVIGILRYDPIILTLSVLFLVFFSGFVNDLLGRFFSAAVRFESVYITALILALILPPVRVVSDFLIYGLIVIVAMSSKYIFAIRNKHIFNPAAIAVFISSLVLNFPATWWVGTTAMAPFVFIGGLLVVRKLRREKMVLSFLITAFVFSFIFAGFTGANMFTYAEKIVFHSSLLFLAFAMLTDPITSPHTPSLQVWFGIIVGFLFTPQLRVGNLYTTPELALLIGNIFSFFVSFFPGLA